MVNIDKLNFSEVMKLGFDLDSGDRKKAREVIGDSRPGYLKIAKTLARYCFNRGVILYAKKKKAKKEQVRFEEACEQIYQGLPEDLQWA